jgi:hypothetical protein
MRRKLEIATFLVANGPVSPGEFIELSDIRGGGYYSESE